MEYKGTVYAKIGGKYIACTESVADLENNIADLTAQLQKANEDKEKLGELLKETYNRTKETKNPPPPGAMVRIRLTLQDCGITL